jgi:dUTP pyrophosphatase
MELKVKRLTRHARLPEKAHADDLGYDIFSSEPYQFEPGDIRTIKTGICISPNNNSYGCIIKDRSSLAMKGMFVHAGIIDAGYRGEVKILFHNASKKAYQIDTGDKVAQLIPHKIINFTITDQYDLHNTKRGAKGFGSTGK